MHVQAPKGTFHAQLRNSYVSVLVCVAKYRRVAFDESVEVVLCEVCLDIASRFEITLLEIGTTATMCIFCYKTCLPNSPTKIVTLIKNLIARQVFAQCPHVKK